MRVTVEDCWLGCTPGTLISINFARECALTLICVDIDTLITDTQWTQVQCPCQWNNSSLLAWNSVIRSMTDSQSTLRLLGHRPTARFPHFIFAKPVHHVTSRLLAILWWWRHTNTTSGRVTAFLFYSCSSCDFETVFWLKLFIVIPAAISRLNTDNLTPPCYHQQYTLLPHTQSESSLSYHLYLLTQQTLRLHADDDDDDDDELVSVKTAHSGPVDIVKPS